VGLAVFNLGDVNVQQVIGGISTGTHGTGRELPCLAAMLVGGRMCPSSCNFTGWTRGGRRTPSLAR